MKRAWAAVVVIALVLPALGYLALRARARDAGERLIAKASALQGRTYPRTTHLPEPGTSAERLAAALQGHVAAKDWAEACSKVARGDEPLEALPAACEAASTADRGWALEAARSGRAQAWSRPDGDPGLTPFMYAMRVATLEVRRRSPDDGVELCVDLLATARDRALGGGLIGEMIGASVVGLVKQPCATALGAASDEKRAWAKQALRGIHDAWPPSGDWVPYEAVGVTVAFHGVLSGEQLARVPPLARPTGATVEEPTFFETLVLMQALPPVMAMFERLERAARLEPAQRDAEVAALEAAEAGAWNPLRSVAAPSYGKFFKRADEARAELLKLAAP